MLSVRAHSAAQVHGIGLSTEKSCQMWTNLRGVLSRLFSDGKLCDGIVDVFTFQMVGATTGGY